MMNETVIQLKATDEVQEFVKAASKCDFDINLQYERAIVDAKSFLGVLSLGLCRDLKVLYGGEDFCFERMLNKFRIVPCTNH